MVSTRIGTLLPKTVTSTAASAIGGNAITTSSTRITDSSPHLRLVAATEPSSAPSTSATAVAPSPMTSE